MPVKTEGEREEEEEKKEETGKGGGGRRAMGRQIFWTAMAPNN